MSFKEEVDIFPVLFIRTKSYRRVGIAQSLSQWKISSVEALSK